MTRYFKKLIPFFMAAVLLLLPACSSDGGETGTPANQKDGVDIVATVFPAYDWTREIIGSSDGAELTLLFDKGVDIHSYQMTADDIIKISDCDIFIYVGGESDEWVNDALAEARNEDMIVVNLMDCLGDALHEEEVVEGMQEEGHEHDDHEHDDHEHDESCYDEHVWLSLRNASLLCGEIAKAISAADSENADVYEANLEAYREKLSALDGEFAESLENTAGNTLMFCDRFPFRYLIEDYDLDYFAAFTGCSAETQADFKTIAFLADKLNEYNMPAVLKIDHSSSRMAETVIDTAGRDGVEILTLNSMQSTTGADADSGVTYISVMEENFDVIKAALG